jgi:hypothetical protein
MRQRHSTSRRRFLQQTVALAAVGSSPPAVEAQVIAMFVPISVMLPEATEAGYEFPCTVTLSSAAGTGGTNVTVTIHSAYDFATNAPVSPSVFLGGVTQWTIQVPEGQFHGTKFIQTYQLPSTINDVMLTLAITVNGQTTFTSEMDIYRP